jgi:hypothetical protein
MLFPEKRSARAANARASPQAALPAVNVARNAASPAGRQPSKNLYAERLAKTKVIRELRTMSPNSLWRRFYTFVAFGAHHKTGTIPDFLDGPLVHSAKTGQPNWVESGPPKQGASWAGDHAWIDPRRKSGKSCRRASRVGTSRRRVGERNLRRCHPRVHHHRAQFSRAR